MPQTKTASEKITSASCHAYELGWRDGRFGTDLFSGDPETTFDRIAYHEGHADGRRIRKMLAADETEKIDKTPKP
ncbi:hypothetical protein [Rubrobacter indicoceani]|uniref:hypothetical protein n=1 Tax=Rubrobacter indicoceani TaxID=2051957 RepID=UPI000E5C37D0|nr:hypothetical protein [Rubrobacter indicoceani]